MHIYYYFLEKGAEKIISAPTYFFISKSIYYRAASTGVYSYPKSSATALNVTLPLATFTPGTNSGNLLL